MKSLAIIPARGGSKGLPGKNIKLFNGEPLIAWAIKCAKASNYVTDIIVSTDDKEIALTSESYGARVVWRPDNLASDTALVIHSIKQVLFELKKENRNYEAICLLEPTAPFRDYPLVDKCLKLVLQKKFNSVATFSYAPVSPNRLWKIEDEIAVPYLDKSIPWLGRQQQPKAYILNGMVYAFSPSNLLNDPNQITFLTQDTHPVIVDDRPGFDIDTEEEFIAAEALFKRIHL